MKKDYLIVECNNKKCFKDTSKRINCASCKEGKLIDVCWNCGKENEVIDSTLRRIDCECGASHIPCELNKYKLRDLQVKK